MVKTIRECIRASVGRSTITGRQHYLEQFDSEADLRFHREMSRPAAISDLVDYVGLHRHEAQRDYDVTTQDLVESFNYIRSSHE